MFKKVTLFLASLVLVFMSTNSCWAVLSYEVGQDDYVFEDEIGLLAEVDLDKGVVVMTIKQESGSFAEAGTLYLIRDGEKIAEQTYMAGDKKIVLEAPLNFTTETHVYQAYIGDEATGRIWTGEIVVEGKWEKNEIECNERQAGMHYEWPPNSVMDPDSVLAVEIVEGDFLRVEQGETFTLHAEGENVYYYVWNSSDLDIVDCGESISWIEVSAGEELGTFQVKLEATNDAFLLEEDEINIEVVEKSSWWESLKSFFANLFGMAKNQNG